MYEKYGYRKYKIKLYFNGSQTFVICFIQLNKSQLTMVDFYYSIMKQNNSYLIRLKNTFKKARAIFFCETNSPFFKNFNVILSSRAKNVMIMR